MPVVSVGLSISNYDLKLTRFEAGLHGAPTRPWPLTYVQSRLAAFAVYFCLLIVFVCCNAMIAAAISQLTQTLKEATNLDWNLSYSRG
jgi:hypothetical protein